MSDNCIFDEYDLDSSLPDMNLKKILRRCKCEDCKRFLKEWYNER